MPAFVLDKCLGAIETMHPLSIPMGYVASAVNVDLGDTEFLRPRAGTARVSLTSGPTAEIVYLFADNTNSRLWAFVAATGTGYYWNGSSWASVSLGSDYSSSATPHCVAYNGKVFMAWDGSSNRLHVYDSVSTSPSVRRVGINAPGTASVANTGAGTYAATLRYYKVQMIIHRDPSDASTQVLAQSELSSSVSFTPSGAGTHARITKPTTVDSATHWRIYGSTDNITFYQITGDLAVGTTTYDDNVTPSNYYAFSGVTAPEEGLFVPPPSAKFLATNGERLFMAGSYETTAAAGETTPATRRVWFTRPIGATDGGDDEAITQTSDSRYYLDIDNDDGSPITGLASTVDGSMYAFTATSVWRLVDTGAADRPISAERVVAGAGALSQYLIATGDNRNTSAVYFMSSDGPYRYSINEGVEYLGADWVEGSDIVSFWARPENVSVMGWDPVYRRMVCGFTEDSKTLTFAPEFASRVGGKYRGGWARHAFAYGSPSFSYTGLARVMALAVFDGRLYYAGKSHNGVSASPVLFYQSQTVTTDDGTAFPGGASIVTQDIVGDETRNMSTSDVYVWKPRAVGASITIENRFGPSALSLVSDTAAAQVGYDSSLGLLHRDKVEGTAIADAATVRLTVTVTTLIGQNTDRADAIVRVSVPYRLQEAA